MAQPLAKSWHLRAILLVEMFLCSDRHANLGRFGFQGLQARWCSGLIQGSPMSL